MGGGEERESGVVTRWQLQWLQTHEDQIKVCVCESVCERECVCYIFCGLLGGGWRGPPADAQMMTGVADPRHS